ncbi:matrixin family metalloprotease [Candidatus Bathyarchaeota archaeon]|nr:matrixin family metalloprotease [Candidatus Bathyarchaeota archaeon]
MIKFNKIVAMTIIATFLLAIPLVAATCKPELCMEVFVYTAEENFAKPPGTPGGKPDNPGKNDPVGYEFLRKGYEWKDLPISIVVDTELEGYSSAIVAATVEWDEHASVVLFGDITFGSGLTWDGGAAYGWTDPDGSNELLFDDYPEDGVIAVCVTWFYRFARDRRIVEFDIMFDTDFTWGDATENPAVMDLQNIATHELGHGLGLADLYEDEWAQQTMYGYATEGETKKRTLDSGDIAGIQALYG